MSIPIIICPVYAQNKPHHQKKQGVAGKTLSSQGHYKSIGNIQYSIAKQGNWALFLEMQVEH